MKRLVDQDLGSLAEEIRAAISRPPKLEQNQVHLIANGDLRLAANQRCWPTQEAAEAVFTKAVAAMGCEIVRAHAFHPARGHGFIQCQREGLDIFRDAIDPYAPIVVFETVWQYSHHILDGLLRHRGPILIVANWSGTWPGLVGAANLYASLGKFGKQASFLWSENFDDEYFLTRLRTWLKTGAVIEHDCSHVRRFKPGDGGIYDVGAAVAERIAAERPICGVFDQDCMGMRNGVFEDRLLQQLSVSREPLSQSALYAETLQVSDEEAQAVVQWWTDAGLQFQFGTDEATELTPAQVLAQAKLYIAAVRIADDFGCAVIGIQYQQGLKDLLPASDLVEGTLNNSDRPPVFSRDGERVLFAGNPVPHANEVDWGAFLGGLFANRLHAALGQEVENTQHDVRWGCFDPTGTVKDFVWVFLLSGSVPPQHFPRGWADASSERQPGMYFRLGGGTLKGVSKPGDGVWHRFAIRNGELELDIGRFTAVELPPEETQRRLDATTPQWPIMHAVLHGITRDQFMGFHRSNHIQVAYCDSAEAADLTVLAFAQMISTLSNGWVKVNLCGTKASGELLQA